MQKLKNVELRKQRLEVSRGKLQRSYESQQAEKLSLTLASLMNLFQKFEQGLLSLSLSFINSSFYYIRILRTLSRKFIIYHEVRELY